MPADTPELFILKSINRPDYRTRVAACSILSNRLSIKIQLANSSHSLPALLMLVLLLSAYESINCLSNSPTSLHCTASDPQPMILRRHPEHAEPLDNHHHVFFSRSSNNRSHNTTMSPVTSVVVALWSHRRTTLEKDWLSFPE